MNSWRTVEYAFMIDLWVRGRWEHEVGTRKLTQAMEVVTLYRPTQRLQIVRCHDGAILWSSH